MLIDRETEGRVAAVVRAIASSFSIYAIGRELGQTFNQAVSSALGITTAGRLTFLETAYLAGKAASILGTDQLKKLGEQQLAEWLQTNTITLTNADRANLNQLKNNTERWLEGRSQAWQAKMRTEIAKADQQWRAVLSATRFNDAHALATARNQSLQSLIDRVNDESAGWKGDINRLVQSEMNNYFQTGQTAALPGDELVYKIPRASACQHCLRITTRPDGSPKLYKLKDVTGNSNVGLPAHAWKFTIGPTHPYCYCILYSTNDRPPKASAKLSEVRKATLKKSLRKNSCGTSDDPDLLFEEQAGHEHEARPAHVTALIKAVKQAYGDTLPGKTETRTM